MLLTPTNTPTKPVGECDFCIFIVSLLRLIIVEESVAVPPIDQGVEPSSTLVTPSSTPTPMSDMDTPTRIVGEIKNSNHSVSLSHCP